MHNGPMPMTCVAQHAPHTDPKPLW
jgi:hypothetical protein